MNKLDAKTRTLILRCLVEATASEQPRALRT